MPTETQIVKDMVKWLRRNPSPNSRVIVQVIGSALNDGKWPYNSKSENSAECRRINRRSATRLHRRVMKKLSQPFRRKARGPLRARAAGKNEVTI